MQKIIQIVAYFLLLTSASASYATCESIEECSGKTDMIAYSCLYHKMVDKSEYDNTPCKKIIVDIGRESFVPMIKACTPEAMTHCRMKKDVDLYICLKKRNGDGISPYCGKKIDFAHDRFAKLVLEKFPDTASPIKPDNKKNNLGGK